MENKLYIAPSLTIKSQIIMGKEPILKTLELTKSELKLLDTALFNYRLEQLGKSEWQYMDSIISLIDKLWE